MHAHYVFHACLQGLELNLTVARICVSSTLMILVFSNKSKVYSCSFALVPELLKEHSLLSTLFEFLFMDWRTNLKTHSKDFCCGLKNVSFIETSIKTRSDVSQPQVLHQVQLASSKDGQKFIVSRKLHSKTTVNGYEYY